MKRLHGIVATLFLAACAHAPTAPVAPSVPSLRVEPENRVTAGNEIPFAGGETIHFDVWGLGPNDVLSFDRCGDPCNTAKNVFLLAGEDDASQQFRSVVLTEPGRYYFWVQRENEKGESGPLFIGDAGDDDEGFRAQFGDDVHVLVRITDGSVPPAPASPPEALCSDDAKTPCDDPLE